MAGKFVLKKSAGGQYVFNLQAGNGKIILTSERYKAKGGAEGGVKAVKKVAAGDKWYDRRTAKNGGPYFVLKAANNEIIGRSEIYSSTSAMENGIKSVKKNAPGSALKDLT